MKHHLGILLQLCVLGALPALIYFQLVYGIRLILMPACLLAGMAVFHLGGWLRES